MSSGKEAARVWLHDRYVAKVNGAIERSAPRDVESLVHDYAAEDPDVVLTESLRNYVECLVARLHT